MSPAHQEARAADFQFWAQDRAYPSVRTGVLSGADIQNTRSACSMMLAGK